MNNVYKKNNYWTVIDLDYASPINFVISFIYSWIVSRFSFTSGDSGVVLNLKSQDNNIIMLEDTILLNAHKIKYKKRNEIKLKNKLLNVSLRNKWSDNCNDKNTFKGSGISKKEDYTWPLMS